MIGVSPVPRTSWPRRGELLAQLAEVVDLAVEDGDDVAGLVRDGLLAGLEVDHAQAAVAEHAAADGVDAPSSGPRWTIAAFMRSTAAGSGPARRGARSPQIPHMHGQTVRGRLLPRRTAAGRRLLAPLLAAPGAEAGRIRDRGAAAAAGREAGEDEELWLERARERRRAGRSGTTRTWPRARAACRGRRASTRSGSAREAAWMRERGLEPRLFCGGGWYIDEDVAAVWPSWATSTARRRRSCRRISPRARPVSPPRARRGSRSPAAGGCSSCRPRIRSAWRRGRRRARCRHTSTCTSTTRTC